MKPLTMVAGVVCTAGIMTTAHAQFVDQIGSSDSFLNTGVGNGAMYSLTGAAESSNGCYNGLACFGNTAIGNGALYSVTIGAQNTATGAFALYVNTDGGYNTADGNGALYVNEDGSFDTATGFHALYSNSASFNSAFGTYALVANTSGSANTAVGYKALNVGVSGSNNTFVGANTTTGSDVASSSSGGDNTAVGANALISFTSGSYNAAVGEEALLNMTSAENNTAFGYQALYHTTTGFGNAAQGASALRANTTGYHNTGIGNAALGANQTGNDNTALGYDAGIAITGSNNIDVANNGLAGESGVIRIGTSLQTAAYVQGIYSTSGLSGALPVVVTSTGQLGVGGSSSEHLKSGISAMGDRTERLQDLKPVTFHYKSDAQGTLQYGLIAEEVAKVYPELVVRDGSGSIYGVRYDELAPMLLNEVQKQAAVIAAADQRIRNLEQQLADVRAAVAELKPLDVHVAKR